MQMYLEMDTAMMKPTTSNAILTMVIVAWNTFKMNFASLAIAILIIPDIQASHLISVCKNVLVLKGNIKSTLWIPACKDSLTWPYECFLAFCDVSKLGNGQCNPEYNTAICFSDLEDCSPTPGTTPLKKLKLLVSIFFQRVHRAFHWRWSLWWWKQFLTLLFWWRRLLFTFYQWPVLPWMYL